MAAHVRSAWVLAAFHEFERLLYNAVAKNVSVHKREVKRGGRVVHVVLKMAISYRSQHIHELGSNVLVCLIDRCVCSRVSPFRRQSLEWRRVLVLGFVRDEIAFLLLK